jgi:hypothetical protein
MLFKCWARATPFNFAFGFLCVFSLESEKISKCSMTSARVYTPARRSRSMRRASPSVIGSKLKSASTRLDASPHHPTTLLCYSMRLPVPLAPRPFSFHITSLAACLHSTSHLQSRTSPPTHLRVIRRPFFYVSSLAPDSLRVMGTAENYDEVLKGKYPAKAHAKKVKEWILSKGGDEKGTIYLEAQKQRLLEVCAALSRKPRAKFGLNLGRTK